MRLLYKYIISPFILEQKRLIDRRGGIKAHIKLSLHFLEIDSDRYVQMTRAKYERDSSYPRRQA